MTAVLCSGEVAIWLANRVTAPLDDLARFGTVGPRSGRAADPRNGAGHPVPFVQRVAIKRVLRGIVHNATIYGTRARARLSCDAETVTNTCEDDGLGIPVADIETKLQPFRRLGDGLARNSEGIGLGLNIAQTIIEDHGGIRVEVRLPLG